MATQDVKTKARKTTHFIKEWRKSRRMTQEKLAELTNMTAGAISQLENGIVNYTQPTLEAIAEALSCTPSDLLSGEPQPVEQTPAMAVRAALLAYGVHAADLSRLMKIVNGFAFDDEDDDEQPGEGRSQSARASRRHEPTP
jgi:transcriptional regulator with XRE-family HTH domain